jgi:metal-responsive CopG/Arc/MetJ family transcriptional regulator
MTKLIQSGVSEYADKRRRHGEELKNFLIYVPAQLFDELIAITKEKNYVSRAELVRSVLQKFVDEVRSAS